MQNATVIDSDKIFVVDDGKIIDSGSHKELLKKCDYYHDRHKEIYILKIITLVLFILSGLLCTINLYYEKSVQILVLGFFYFINGILEAIDPITYYLIEKQK